MREVASSKAYRATGDAGSRRPARGWREAQKERAELLAAGRNSGLHGRVNCCGHGLVDAGLLATAQWTPSEIPKREAPAKEGRQGFPNAETAVRSRSQQHRDGASRRPHQADAAAGVLRCSCPPWNPLIPEVPRRRRRGWQPRHRHAGPHGLGSPIYMGTQVFIKSALSGPDNRLCSANFSHASRTVTSHFSRKSLRAGPVSFFSTA